MVRSGCCHADCTCESVSLTRADRETDGMLIDNSWVTGRPAGGGQGQGALSTYKTYICQRPQRLFNENDLWLKLEGRGSEDSDLGTLDLAYFPLNSC